MDEKELMQRFSNILHNASQGDIVTKDQVIDAIKNLLIEYNKRVTAEFKVPIYDFRK